MTYVVDPSAVANPQLLVASGVQTIHSGGKNMQSWGNITFVREGGQWKMLTVAGVGLGGEHVGNMVHQQQ